MARQYGFSRISDREVIRLLFAISAMAHDGTVSVGLLDNVSFSVPSGGDVPAEWDDILTENSYLIRSADVYTGSLDIRVAYFRQQSYKIMNGSGYWLPAELPFVDGIEVTGPNQNPAINGPELLRIISKFINMVPPLEAASLSSTSVQKSEQILHQMSQAVADITQQAAVVLSDVERRRIEIEEQLDIKLAKKQEALDVEHAERLRALTERESELNLKLQELDNSDNTHSRRALAARMRDLSSNTLKQALLESSNSAFYIPVGFALISSIVIGIFAFMSAWWLSEYVNGKSSEINSSILYFMEARTVVLGVGTAALLWFTLRLLSSRYRQVAQWESELHRFSLDTERASFLVEADLEARKISSEPLPQVVLESFSRGLFGSSGGGENSHEGVGSALTTILNRPASLKLSTNGMEVVVDKAGLSKARKEIDSGE